MGKGVRSLGKSFSRKDIRGTELRDLLARGRKPGGCFLIEVVSACLLIKKHLLERDSKRIALREDRRGTSQSGCSRGSLINPLQRRGASLGKSRRNLLEGVLL